MSGYRIPDENTFINATTINSQATRAQNGQRAVTTTANEAQGRRVTLGVGRDTSSNFSGFGDPAARLQDSLDSFLAVVEPSQNPDFIAQGGFDPANMKNFDELTQYDNLLQIKEDAGDQPFIGQGPNLKAQNINDVIAGNIQNVDRISPSTAGSSGFGWYDDVHETTTIGSYFKKKYSFGAQIASPSDDGIVTKGERVDTRNVDYSS